MNKKDRLLAQKTLGARQLKAELQFFKEHKDNPELLKDSMRMSSRGFEHTRPRPASRTPSYLSTSLSSLPTINSPNKSVGNSNSSNNNSEHIGGSFNGSQRSGRSNGSQKRPSTTMSNSSNRLMSNMDGRGEVSGKSGGGSQYQSPLVAELSLRSATDLTTFRKLQSNISKQVRSELSIDEGREGEHAEFAEDGSPMGNSSSTMENSPKGLKQQVNFMPKKKLFRADGASLHDVYLSKKEDFWGKIIKAQYKEELEDNKEKRIQKMHKDDEYGLKLKQQIQDNERRAKAARDSNDNFGLLEGAKAAAMADMEASRVQGARDRHKQFIANAIHDIEVKKKAKEIESTQEITASTMMINHDMYLLAEEQRKKDELRAQAAAEQERLFQENLASLAKKEADKQKSWAEDKKIFAEREAAFQKNEERKRNDLMMRTNKSTEGPAHKIVDAINKEKKRKEEEFYMTLQRSANSLQNQLKATEEATEAKNNQNGAWLLDEFEKTIQYKNGKKRADEERNAKILDTMRSMLDRQEQEDREKRAKKMEAAKQYQIDLDNQLAALRNKSKAALSRTMSTPEVNMNKMLITKAEKFF